MKKNISKYCVLALAAVLAACSPQKENYDADTAFRVTLYPEPVEFLADGSAPGESGVYEAVVLVNSGAATSDMGWTASLEGNPSWATLSEATVNSTFKETYSDKEHQISQKGISVTVKPNTEYRRKAVLNITLANGSVFPFVLQQLGLKADAALEVLTKDVAKNGVEFIAAGGKMLLEYSTNMGDLVSYSSSAEWLEWIPGEPGFVTLKAAKWTDKENGREAVFTITIGSPDTSEASVDIKITQLPADEFYFLWGESVRCGTEIAQAIQMSKGDGNIHSSKQFFNKGEGGNRIWLNPESRELSYPCFILASDGKVVEVASADATLPDGPEIDVDGLRNLSVNMNAKTWTWNRISTANCTPDSEVANYKTKAYTARDGSQKIWMTEWLRWDGGDIWPKLGSGQTVGLVNTATGGYKEKEFPKTWDDMTYGKPEYETVESGLGTLEVSSEKGRIYAFSELINGVPTFGRGFARYEPLPGNWQRGSVIVDAVGDSYELECLKTVTPFTADPAADEEAHPTLKMQVQGICPYGWHVANASDWLDLAWAASLMSNGDSYPVRASDVNYMEFTGSGIPNFATWLKQAKYYNGAKDLIADGADEFDFNYYPLGIRYMTQGFTWQGTRAQTWVPLVFDADKGEGWYSTFRINVMIVNNAQDKAQMVNLDNGQAICPIRCVKNYIKK